MAKSQEDDERQFYKRLATHQQSEYDGEPYPIRFEDWIAHMDMVDNLKVKLAAFYVSDLEELWWRALKNTMVVVS